MRLDECMPLPRMQSIKNWLFITSKSQNSQCEPNAPSSNHLRCAAVIIIFFSSFSISAIVPCNPSNLKYVPRPRLQSHRFYSMYNISFLIRSHPQQFKLFICAAAAHIIQFGVKSGAANVLQQMNNEVSGTFCCQNMYICTVIMVTAMGRWWPDRIIIYKMNL